jgi:hypothetical protein
MNLPYTQLVYVVMLSARLQTVAVRSVLVCTSYSRVHRILGQVNELGNISLFLVIMEPLFAIIIVRV